MTTPNQCQFWDCKETIRRDHYLCLGHYTRHQTGDIDKCPSCGKYKDAHYDVCLNCYRQTASTWATSRTQVTEWGTREFSVDRNADRFFVYVLLLNDGTYYPGQTREMLERLHEHRNNQASSTRGKEPKLQWFTAVSTRREAVDLEAYLQQLNSNPAGRREINRMVVDFKKLAGELDYEPHLSAVQSTVQELRMPYGGVTPPPFQRRSLFDRLRGKN